MAVIKTKFMLEDKVYCMQNNKITEFIVKRIDVEVNKDGTYVKYADNAYSTNPKHRLEGECFATKDALIKSLL